MKLKLYTHNLKCNIDDDLPKVIKYFADNQVYLTIDREETLIEKQNSQQLFYKNDGKYDIVCYMFDRFATPMASFGLAFNVSNTLRGIYLASSIQDDNVDYTWKSMCHEIMHCLVYKVKADTGIQLIDYMDTYIKNEEPYATDGNFAMTWKQLEHYKYLFTPIVTLTRTQDTGVETLGTLSFGSFSCKTLEGPWKNNQPNISCIPKGQYQVKYTFSPKFLKYTYEIQDVPNRSGIRIHSANYFFDLQGCIALGNATSDINHDNNLDIINSRATVASFEKLMGKLPFVLIIK